MIRKLKIKFVILSMTSLFLLLLLIVAGMNLLNYNSVINNADEILDVLSKNKGNFPINEGDRNDPMPPGMSPEAPYESRFFSVLLDSSGEVILIDTSRIASVTDDMACEYGKNIIEDGNSRGFTDRFRFVSSSENGDIRITFLDCGRELDSFHNSLLTSVGMALAGFLIVFFVISFFAGRIIRPIAESHEKQKRFITDAGHEIKTPLTIISANVDILEMDFGENESLEDIKHQIKRLTSLTNDLTYLARMDESDIPLQMIEFPISEAVSEVAIPFKALAQTQGKEFIINIQPMLTMYGDYKAIQQLVSILMDNALKYSPKGGTITLDFAKQAKLLCLTVFNDTETVIHSENLRHVFDRFYRSDFSRNSETGGHGIGLSVAKAIVVAHKGKIQATTQDGKSFRITVMLPAKKTE